MADIRNTQIVIESASPQADAPAERFSQIVIESASPQDPSPTIRESQVILESLSRQPATPTIRESQVVIETISSQLAQIAGPDADVDQGGWTPSTGTDLYPMVNEFFRDDSTFIQSEVDPVDDSAIFSFGHVEPVDGPIEFLVIFGPA